MNKYGKTAIVFLQSAIVAIALAYFFNLMGNLLVRHTWTALGKTIRLVPDSTQTFEIDTEFKTKYHVRICPWDTSSFVPMPVQWHAMLKKDTVGSGSWDGSSPATTSDDTCLALGEFNSWANDTYKLYLHASRSDSTVKPQTVDLQVAVAPQFRENYELRARLNHMLSKMVVWLAAALGLGAVGFFITAIVKR